MFRLGLIINPYAGLGGSVALKGSDGEAIRTEALARGAKPQAQERTERALKLISNHRNDVEIFTFAGDMGGDLARQLNFKFRLVGSADTQPSSPDDTVRAAKAIQATGVDLILFAGGDGTARLIADAVAARQPVLGVPAGVKMHSGVYAIGPEAAGEILLQLLTGQLVSVAERDVKDIDEDAFRLGQVRARFYGSLWVPEDSNRLQQVKNAGHERDELAQLDVALEFVERLDSQTLYLIGPGSTTQVILQQLGLEGTLLGVDALMGGRLLGTDLSAEQLAELLEGHPGPAKIVVTAIGGQGHIFGRGNQQLSAAIIRRVGMEHVIIVAARGKILSLEGRPLLVDTNDPQLDAAFCGFRPVIVGYRDTILYPVAGGRTQ